MPESDKKKVVPFSVRFDPALFDSIEKHLGGIKRDERPSKDRFIQDAVLLSLRTRQVPGNRDSIDVLSADVIKSPNIDIRESEIKWVRLLIAILRCKYQQIATAIQHNLEAFSLILRAEGERGGGGPSKPGGSGPKSPGPFEKGRSTLDAADRAFGRPPRSGRSKKAGGA